MTSFYGRKTTANYNCKLPVILRGTLISQISRCEKLLAVDVMKYIKNNNNNKDTL